MAQMRIQSVLFPLQMAGAILRNSFCPRVEQLILHVTRRCPLDCAHCFVRKETSSEGEITVAEARQIAGQLNPLTRLSIGGGEPFLRQDLPELCLPFQAAEYTIPTNGWLVDRTIKTSERLFNELGPRLQVFVSIDGLKPTHDALRQAGSFDRALATLEGLKRLRGLRVGVVTTVSSANYRDIPELVRFLDRFDLCMYTVNFMRGDVANPALLLPSPEEMEILRKELFDLLGSRYYNNWKGPWGRLLSRFQFRYAKKRWQVQQLTLKEKRQVVPCVAGRSHLVIYSNGDVAPCEMLPPVGNIRQTPLPELRTSPKFCEVVRAIRAGKCFCTHECPLSDSILLNVKTLTGTLLRR